jgi:FHA domain-containing protein
VQRGPEPPASQRPPAAHAPPLASEEVRSIAERAADAHRAAFEIPTTTQPTDLLNRLNQAQLDALREQGGGRPAAAPGGSAAGAPAAAGAAPGASSGAARGQAEELAFELLKSLLVGLGLSELPKSPIAGQATAGPPTLSPELMRRLGELLKVATQGTLDLLQVRATVKRELKAEVTIIASMDNNPLKFSPDSQAALAHLLSNRSVRGFMDPVPAMRDAYDDLLAHQVGFVAGMRAAMQGLIARFDPGELETRLTRKSVMDSMLPMTRRSRLWELYQQMFTEISREAEDDFERLFGREFLRAYEEQIDRLKDAQR